MSETHRTVQRKEIEREREREIKKCAELPSRDLTSRNKLKKDATRG